MIERVPLLVQLCESSNLAALDNNFQDKSAALTSLRVLSQIGLGFGTMSENFTLVILCGPGFRLAINRS